MNSGTHETRLHSNSIDAIHLSTVCLSIVTLQCYIISPHIHINPREEFASGRDGGATCTMTWGPHIPTCLPPLFVDHRTISLELISCLYHRFVCVLFPYVRATPSAARALWTAFAVERARSATGVKCCRYLDGSALPALESLPLQSKADTLQSPVRSDSDLATQPV